MVKYNKYLHNVDQMMATLEKVLITIIAVFLPKMGSKMACITGIFQQIGPIKDKKGSANGVQKLELH